MNQYLALFFYCSTLLYAGVRISQRKPISRWDFFGFVMSYAFFGLALVLEKFIA